MSFLLLVRLGSQLVEMKTVLLDPDLEATKSPLGI